MNTESPAAPAGPGWSTLHAVLFLTITLAVIFAIILPFCD